MVELTTELEKLTDWENEPNLMDLKEDLMGSKTAHDSHAQKVDKWNNLSKIEGSVKPTKIKGRSSVQPKLVRRQAEWRYSALSEPFLGSDKLYDIDPVTFEDKEGARQNDLVLNYQFRTKINKVKFIDEYVRTAVDEGSVIVRVGWKRETELQEIEVPTWTFYPIENEQDVQFIQQAIQLETDNPRKFNETIPDNIKQSVQFFKESNIYAYAEQVGVEKLEIEKVLDNRPTIDIINCKNFYPDPSCGGDLDKAMFIIYTFETSISELERNTGIYKNLKAINVESAGPISNADHDTTTPSDFQFKDNNRKKLIAYEYWGYYDIHNDGKLVPILVTWVGDIIIRMEENPFPDNKPPFVVVSYLPVKRELFGEPDAELLEDNQAILGALTRGMIDLLGRSANSQQGFAKGMLDVVNRRKFDNGLDYEFNPNMNPTQGIIEHKYPEIPNSALTLLQIQNTDAESLTGVKSFSGGLSGNAYGDVAAGIRGVLDAASKREMAILRRLAKGVIEIGNKIIAMNAVFLSEVEVIRITNDEFVTIKREDLVGNYDLMVDISTAEVDNAKAQDLGFMLQTIGPNLDFSVTKEILIEIATLKRMPSLAETLRRFEPKPDPLAEKLKELAVVKAEAEIEKIRSEIEYNKARAQAALSQKDLTDLNYVQEYDGTSHRREMSRNQAQSRGNRDLKVVDAMLKPSKEGETKPNINEAIAFNAATDAYEDAKENIPVESTRVRDVLASENPAYSLNSKFYDPSLDPASNPGINI